MHVASMGSGAFLAIRYRQSGVVVCHYEGSPNTVVSLKPRLKVYCHFLHFFLKPASRLDPPGRQALMALMPELKG